MQHFFEVVFLAVYTQLPSLLEVLDAVTKNFFWLVCQLLHRGALNDLRVLHSALFKGPLYTWKHKKIL